VSEVENNIFFTHITKPFLFFEEFYEKNSVTDINFSFLLFLSLLTLSSSTQQGDF
jgi:hypothetical protein